MREMHVRETLGEGGLRLGLGLGLGLGWRGGGGWLTMVVWCAGDVVRVVWVVWVEGRGWGTMLERNEREREGREGGEGKVSSRACLFEG